MPLLLLIARGSRQGDTALPSQPVRGKEPVMDEKIRANRKYKDSVFRMLFRSKAALLGLYNALRG